MTKIKTYRYVYPCDKNRECVRENIQGVAINLWCVVVDQNLNHIIIDIINKLNGIAHNHQFKMIPSNGRLDIELTIWFKECIDRHTFDVSNYLSNGYWNEYQYFYDIFESI